MRREAFILLLNFAFLPGRIFVAMATSAFFASGSLPCHSPLAPTAFSRQARHLSPWQRMILENMGSGTSFPPWPQFVARATSCQAGFCCHSDRF